MGCYLISQTTINSILSECPTLFWMKPTLINTETAAGSDDLVNEESPIYYYYFHIHFSFEIF